MLQLICVFFLSRELAFYNANMKAKYAIKGLLRIHAVRGKQTRKMFSVRRRGGGGGGRGKTVALWIMQIGFMEFVHKHQFNAVANEKETAPRNQHKSPAQTH